MRNAVWVYMNDKLRGNQGFSEFLAWARWHQVKVVILYFAKDELYVGRAAAVDTAAFVERCRREGLEVHGMISAFMSPPQAFLGPGYEECFAVDWHGCSSRTYPAGGVRYFLDPNKGPVLDMLRKVVRQLLKTYPQLDGVQLDFIRYFHSTSILTIDSHAAASDLRLVIQPEIRLSGERGQAIYFLETSSVKSYDPPIGGVQRYYHNYHYCYCDKCLQDFSSAFAVSLPFHKSRAELAREIEEKYAQEWYAFRAGVITNAVRAVREEIAGLCTGKQLSATFWYNSPYGNRLTGKHFRPGSEYTDFGQAWYDWAKTGLVDFFCPMNYWLSPVEYGEITSRQVERMGGSVPIYSGLLASPDFPSPKYNLEEYQRQGEKSGAAGICFFAYHTWA